MSDKKNSSGKLKSVLAIIGVVVLAIALYSVASALNIESYSWVFELIVFLAAVCAVYYILRINCEYTYDIVDNNMIFKQKMGKGERYVFAFDLKYLRRVMDKETADAEIARLGLKGIPKYYTDKAEGDVYGLLYYDASLKCEKILTFKPSGRLIEILSKKAIDNTAEM